jgi:hypothetical protein
MKMPHLILIATILPLILVGCGGNIGILRQQKPAKIEIEECDPLKSDCPVVQTPDENTFRPKPRPGTATAGAGFVEGVAAAELDETTQAEKQAALDTGTAKTEKKLGTTIATLGDVGQQGFWLKTPLVLVETEGRIVWAADGNSVKTTLLPKQGEDGSGSQISLAAMRALGIPLTALAELIVFSE